MIRYAQVKYFSNGENVTNRLPLFKDYEYNQYVPEDCVFILVDAENDLCQNGFYVQLVDDDDQVVFSEKFQTAGTAECWLSGVAVAINHTNFLEIGPRFV